MKRIIFLLIFGALQFSVFNSQLCEAQNLCVGSVYVGTPDEEKLLGDGGDVSSARLPVLGNMLAFEEPDVVGLQSLTTSQQSTIRRYISGYKAAGDILYGSLCTLDTCGVVEGLPEGSTCSWAKLRKEEHDFYVFNMCFSSEASVATSSTTQLITLIRGINEENLPMVLVGYLGVPETKTAYSRLNGRYYDCYTKASVISAEYGTKNDFDLEANHGTERYDFIFVSRTGFNIDSYGQLQYGYFTKESDGTYKRRLPSPHFPILAKLTLK